jgi:hypothetical protein
MRGHVYHLCVAGMCVAALGGLPWASVWAGTGHAHVHPTEGPHHGSLIELGREEYHAELVHDHHAGTVTIYILDGAAAAAVPTTAKQAMLNLVVAGKPRQFRLMPVPQPADPTGTASAFTGTGEELCHAIDAKDLKGRLNVEITGKIYTGGVRPQSCSHAHD